MIDTGNRFSLYFGARSSILKKAGAGATGGGATGYSESGTPLATKIRISGLRYGVTKNRLKNAGGIGVTGGKAATSPKTVASYIPPVEGEGV